MPIFDRTRTSAWSSRRRTRRRRRLASASNMRTSDVGGYSQMENNQKNRQCLQARSGFGGTLFVGDLTLEKSFFF